uniref:Uncharacterized protein n=1 Tax=Morchella brunnea TaxID=1174671 RepID=A0A8K1I5K3_9PEZI|nr:hypothetical protein LK370_mgp078 [Morchella brunnea]UBU98450.1 hypothetical protein [Morchella brunnea]
MRERRGGAPLEQPSLSFREREVFFNKKERGLLKEGCFSGKGRRCITTRILRYPSPPAYPYSASSEPVSGDCMQFPGTGSSGFRSRGGVGLKEPAGGGGGGYT